MELSKLPEHIFHTPRKLVTLNLAGNLLKTLPDALTYAINLETLTLDENPMENLEGEKLVYIFEIMSMRFVSNI